MFPVLRFCLVLCLHMDGKFAESRILPSGSRVGVKVPLNAPIVRRNGRPSASTLSVRGGGEPPPLSLITTISQTQEAVKSSHSAQVALRLLRMGCVVGAFLYQGCLAVAERSPCLVADIESKSLLIITQAVLFLATGGGVASLLAQVLKGTEGRSIFFPFRKPADWLDFIGEKAAVVLSVSIAGIFLVRVLDTLLSMGKNKDGRGMRDWEFKIQEPKPYCGIPVVASCCVSKALLLRSDNAYNE
jgi:hypothetical protein